GNHSWQARCLGRRCVHRRLLSKATPGAVDAAPGRPGARVSGTRGANAAAPSARRAIKHCAKRLLSDSGDHASHTGLRGPQWNRQTNRKMVMSNVNRLAASFCDRLLSQIGVTGFEPRRMSNPIVASPSWALAEWHAAL